MTTYTFTWYDADDTSYAFASNGWAVQRGAIGLEGTPVELGYAQALNRDGAVITRTRGLHRNVILPLHLTDTAPVDEVSNLYAALRNGPGRLRVSNGTRTRELRDVYYEAGLEGDWSSGVWGQDAWAKRAISLVALDPYWQETADESDASVVTEDVIVNAGDVPAYPVWTITGAYTTFNLQYGTTGAETDITLSSSLASGATIVVDTRPWEQFYGPAGPTDSTNLDWSLITDASTLGPLDPGNNSISITSTGTDGSSDVSVVWRERFYVP